MKIEENLLDEQIKLKRNLRKEGKDKKFGFDLPMKIFLKLMYSSFTPQSYGARIENRLLLEYNMIKVKSSQDKGDAKTTTNKFIEIKSSFKDNDGKFNFVQIRPHQKCDGYLLFAIDIDDNFKQYSFLITDKDIKKVLTICKASNCHGVSKNKKDKSQEELRFSVDPKSENWKYLCENFTSEDMKNKLSTI